MKRSRLKLSKKARQSSQEWYHSKKSPKSVTEHHLPPLDEPSPAISTSSSPPPVHFKPRLHSPKSTSTFESEHKPEYTLPSPSARSLDYSEPIEETAIKNELYVLPSHCHCQLVKKNANKQTSLLSYLSVKSSTKKTALPSSEEVRMQHVSSKGQDSRPTQMYKRTPKTCPFYKRIPGSQLTIIFHLASSESCTILSPQVPVLLWMLSSMAPYQTAMATSSLTFMTTTMAASRRALNIPSTAARYIKGKLGGEGGQVGGTTAHCIFVRLQAV